MMNLLDLPCEMLQLICSYLDAKSLSTFGQTCRYVLEISNIDHLWQDLCMKDYQVVSNKGWSLSFKDIYTKVLFRYKLLGLKRLALLPYGGLVNVSWCDGEIQVNGYGVCGHQEMMWEPYFSLRWSHSSDELEAFCVLNESPDEKAIFIPDQTYPLLQWANCSSMCVKNNRKNTLLTTEHGKSSKAFAKGFLDHPRAFLNIDLSQGFNCPLLPMPILTNEDASRSPISLGLYSGDYGSHGTEIVFLRISTPSELEGLKISGDPNVPAGYTSIHVSLDKPIILSESDQESIDQMLEADRSRPEQKYLDLLNSNIDTEQPFCNPVSWGQDNSFPNKCMARYLCTGRIAGHNYTRQTFCRAHFIKFTNELFAVLWLDLYAVSTFHKIRDDVFSISSQSKKTMVKN